jgi:teichuronic acid biosynthesis glycosyltransferase TuaC
MRVLAVTNMYPTQDRPFIGTFIEHQVRGLRELGLEVRVLYLDRYREGMGVYRHTARLVRAERDAFEPDLVHVMYGGVMAYHVAKAIRDRPIVLTLHNSDILGENLSGLIRKGISHVGVWCSRYASSRVAKVVIVSQHLARALPRSTDPADIVVIPCGIDLALFRPLPRADCRARLGWDDAGFNVLFPANMGDPRKRPELAREAVELLRRDGIPARLRVLQGVPYDEVPTWFNACDVHILTSQEEGSPTTVKEALACNVPVVSVDVGDVAERLRRVDGCSIAKADPFHLAEGLRRVYDGSRRVDGHEAVLDLSIQQIALRLRSLYEGALSAYQAAQPRRRKGAHAICPS